jgi:transcription elongation factor Elf1
MAENGIFVKIDEYRDVVDILNLTKDKIKEAKDTLEKVQHLKAQEDAEIESWHAEIEEAERRVSFLDRTLYDLENS